MGPRADLDGQKISSPLGFDPGPMCSDIGQVNFTLEEATKVLRGCMALLFL